MFEFLCFFKGILLGLLLTRISPPELCFQSRQGYGLFFGLGLPSHAAIGSETLSFGFSIKLIKWLIPIVMIQIVWKKGNNPSICYFDYRRDRTIAIFLLCNCVIIGLSTKSLLSFHYSAVFDCICSYKLKQAPRAQTTVILQMLLTKCSHIEVQGS
jgi:hypothetical protein